jgi:hypothetical protein
MTTYGPRKVRVCLYESAHRSRVAWWIEAESKRHRVEDGRYLLVDGQWGSRVGDGLHRYLRYEANAQQVLRESAGVISPLGVGTLRGNDIRRCLRCEENAQHVPHWGAGVVDSLWTDSRRGAASCVATVAPSPPPTARRVAGQTRMLLFRHGGEDVVEFAAAGRADGRHCCCRAAGGGVPCRSCRRGT